MTQLWQQQPQGLRQSHLLQQSLVAASLPKGLCRAAGRVSARKQRARGGTSWVGWALLRPERPLSAACSCWITCMGQAGHQQVGICTSNVTVGLALSGRAGPDGRFVSWADAWL